MRVSIAHNPDRAEEEIAVLGSGAVVGEMALLDEMPRSASVTVLEDVGGLESAFAKSGSEKNRIASTWREYSLKHL